MLKMKDNGFRLDGERVQWEMSQNIVIFDICNKYSLKIEEIMTTLRNTLAEFSLPFEVRNCSKEELIIIQKPLKAAINDRKIDEYSLMDNITKFRKNNGALEYGIVILCSSEYSLKDPKAIWGWADDDGLIILRNVEKKVVRHELGHMLGLGTHCKNKCVMTDTCKYIVFCTDCKRKLNDVWKQEG